MQGFAVVDRQSEDGEAAVWITSRTGEQRAGHTNACVIDLRADLDPMERIRSLTRSRSVLLTDGSTTDGLPILGSAMTPVDIDDLVHATATLQQQVLDALDAYASRSRGRNSLVAPVFLPLPTVDQFPVREDSASQRAFQTANYLAAAWTAWLATDEQRRRRSIQPRTNETPWIMPEDMSSPEIALFPAAYAERLNAQPWV